MAKTLVLNTTYEPLSVVSDRRAAVLMLRQRAVMVEPGRRTLHSASLTIPTASVIKLTRYVRVPYRRSIPLTRTAIFARDRQECQYCAASAETIDHIIPRSRGGEHTWENVAACCRRCNLKKRDRTPTEWGRPLLRRPKRPSRFGWVYATGTELDPAWETYLALGA